MPNDNNQPVFKNMQDPDISHLKGWGTEAYLLNNLNLCCKILTIKPGKRCSMHFHKNKSEIFFIIQGSMLLAWIDTNNGGEHSQHLVVGDSVFIPPCLPHQFYSASTKIGRAHV